MNCKKHSPVVLTLALVAAVYYALVRLNLFVCDDFRYTFVQGTNKPVQTMADALSSQCHAYMFENGRFLVHTLVQCFAGMWGIEWLRICNTLFFIVFIWCSTMLVNRGKGNQIDVSLILLVCLTMLFAIPVFGYSFLGNIACSVNYLWTASLSLTFLCVLNFYEGKKCRSVVLSACLCLCAAVVGAMQESFSIGLSVGVFVWMLMNRKRVNATQVALILSYCIGSAVVILAPSNFLREAAWNSGSTSFVLKIASGMCSIVLYCRTMMALCVCLIVGALVFPKKMKAFCKENICLLITTGISAIFVASVAFTGPHQLVSIEMFSAIVLLRLLMRSRRFYECLHSKCAVLLLSALLIGVWVPIYYYRCQVKNAYEQMINSARNSTDGCMIGGEYDKLSFGKRNFFVKNYTSTELNQNVPLTSLSMYLTKGKNRSFIHTRLPRRKKEIVSMCTEGNNWASKNVYHQEGECFYVVKSPKNVATILIEKKPNWMSNLRATLLSRETDTQTETVNAASLSKFNVGDTCYYIIYDSEAYPIVNISIK